MTKWHQGQLGYGVGIQAGRWKWNGFLCTFCSPLASSLAHYFLSIHWKRRELKSQCQMLYPRRGPGNEGTEGDFLHVYKAAPPRHFPVPPLCLYLLDITGSLVVPFLDSGPLSRPAFPRLMLFFSILCPQFSTETCSHCRLDWHLIPPIRKNQTYSKLWKCSKVSLHTTHSCRTAHGIARHVKTACLS